MLLGHRVTLRGKAVVEVEVYTPTGVLAGMTARAPLATDTPEDVQVVNVTSARWYPLDGSEPAHQAATTVFCDDILLVVTPEPELKVHMAWYSIAVDVGPYRISGRLATHPGFDPAKALLRPGGTFIALSDARIELVDRPDTGVAERPHVLVNRYAVDRVTSTLMLGHYFPGARFVTQESASVA